MNGFDFSTSLESRQIPVCIPIMTHIDILR